MRQVQGKDVLLEIIIPGSGLDYLPYACSTTISFYSDRELIEKTTFDSGSNKEWTTGLEEWGAALGGITHVLPENGLMSVFNLLVEAVRRNAVQIRLSFSDTDGNVKTILGFALIPHIGISADAEGFAQDDIELKGTGAFSIGTTLVTTPINTNEVYDYEYFGIGGETWFEYANLFGRTIIGVWRGYPLDKISAGVPTELQVLHEGTRLTFAATAPLGAGEYILVLYK